MHQRLRMLNLNFFTPLLLLYIPSSLTPSQFFFKPLLIQQNVFCFMPYISMPLKNPTRFTSFLFFLLFLMIPMVLLSFGSCFPQLFLLLFYFHVFYPVVASQVNTKRKYQALGKVDTSTVSPTVCVLFNNKILPQLLSILLKWFFII